MDDLSRAGQDAERAVYGHRHDGQLPFVGQLEGPFLEVPHVSRKRACPFGEDDHRRAFFQYLFGLLYGLHYFFRPGVVHEDVPRVGASLAHEGYLAERFLHQPLEVASQVAVDQENVESPLVVGHEDIRSLPVYVFPPFHAHPYEQQRADDFTPDASRVVAPEVRVSQCAARGGHEGGQDGRHQQDGQRDADFVRII